MWNRRARAGRLVMSAGRAIAAVACLFVVYQGFAQELMRDAQGNLVGLVRGKRTVLDPSKYCARAPRGLGSTVGAAIDTAGCHQLPAAEFHPLSVEEFIGLNGELEALSACVLRYEMKDMQPDFFGNSMDDKLWRRVIKAGKARDLFVEASALPGYITAAEVASLSPREINKQFPKVIWDLQNYAMGADRKQLDTLRARSIYYRYTAMGTKGECVPSETFTRLLEKSAQP